MSDLQTFQSNYIDNIEPAINDVFYGGCCITEVTNELFRDQLNIDWVSDQDNFQAVFEYYDDFNISGV
jgi:hypothetical protein